MKRIWSIVLLGLLPVIAMGATKNGAYGGKFEDAFADSTLRLDYILAGNDTACNVYLKELCRTAGWHGRRHAMEHPLLRGNGAVWMTDPATGDTLYGQSFSTLFQEWRCQPEAKSVDRGYEHSMTVPYPLRPVDVTLELYDNRRRTVASLTHRVDPKDILIRETPHTGAETVLIFGDEKNRDAIDLVVVAEGYTAAEREKFLSDARRVAEALMGHAPFSEVKEHFNIRAVFTVSEDSGPSVPSEGVWNRTAHRSHYDTFYSTRYLTTSAMHALHNSIAGVPYEHIIMLVNTPRYGGGGIYNQLTVCSSDHPTFTQVLVHEFGHAFAGLADEYFTPGDDSDLTYPVDIEPWEPNITTLTDFGAKWEDMVPCETEIPTAPVDMPPLKTLDLTDPKNVKMLEEATQNVGVFEGAGYKTHGIYRPVQECRMKVNEVKDFCPVCTRAILQMVHHHIQKFNGY